MSRSITILIALIVVLFGFLMLRSFYSDTTPAIDPKMTPLAQVKPAAEGNFQNWREFSSATKRFKVLFPTLPQHVADKVPDSKTGEMRKYETFIAADDHGGAVMISAITFSRNVQGETGELNAAITDILSRNKENNLKDMKPSRFRDRPAMDFAISSKEMSIAGKVFANGNTIYVLSMIDKNEMFNPQELAFFVNSFELITDDKTNKSTPK